MRRKLTKRQSEVYALIKQLFMEKGYPPTVAEITDNFHVGMSLTAIRDHTKALIRKGYVEHAPAKPRSLRPKTLAIATTDMTDLAIKKGDYCHITGNKITAITRKL